MRSIRSMEYTGIGVHKNQGQPCLITEAGEVLHQRIHTGTNWGQIYLYYADFSFWTRITWIAPRLRAAMLKNGS